MPVLDMTLTVSPTGELVLPAELVPAKPNERVEVAREGDTLVLKPAGSQTAGESQRSRHSIRSLPLLPGAWTDLQPTFRREDIYGEDGR